MKVGTVIYGELLEPSRRDVLREIIHEFPDKLSCEEADKLLSEGLELAALKPYDKRRDKNALTLIRREEGFEVRPGAYWERQKNQTGKPLPSSPHNTGEGTGQSLRSSSFEGTLDDNHNRTEELTNENHCAN